MLSRVSRCCFCTVAARPWLFVGLGNPGEKYKGTRHNVGFEMIDAFAESQGILMNTVHCKAIFGEGFIGRSAFLLAKPQTYMNLSGESSGCVRLENALMFIKCILLLLGPKQVFLHMHCCKGMENKTGPLAAYYKLPLNRVIVVHDDMDLPCGVLRLQHKGGHGRHNGLKSVIYHFRGNKEFARLRIGIGRPPGQMDPKAFLLQKFNTTAQERIDAALPEGVAALKSILSRGLTETARCFNQEQKYKHIRLQTMPT